MDQERPFDVAIVNMQMQVMDGESFGKEVKGDPDLAGTMLIMLTTVGQRGDAARLKEIGFAAYLTKPIRQSQLYDCLATVMARQALPKSMRSASLVTKHSLSEDQKAKIRILLAEDDPTNQQVALILLERLGLRVDAVVNGKEAVEALEKVPYNLVLMDIQMPEMDGLEATKIIRDPESRVLNHHVPVIAMTAHAMKGDRERCLKAGMDDYVTKPIEPQRLTEAIERQVRNSAEAIVPSHSVQTFLSDEEAFDRSVVLDRVGGDERLLKKVMSVFLEDIPVQLEQLKKAVNEEDTERIWSQGHRIKGSSANIGAQGMRDMAFEIEKAGKAVELDRVRPLVVQLEQEFRKIEAVFSDKSDLFIKTNKGTPS
jgi:CheY-like chemotaxis protein/HPt (histidine-containing phosphotransfer) domain-containing protein